MVILCEASTCASCLQLQKESRTLAQQTSPTVRQPPFRNECRPSRNDDTDLLISAIRQPNTHGAWQRGANTRQFSWNDLHREAALD